MDILVYTVDTKSDFNTHTLTIIQFYIKKYYILFRYTSGLF